MTDRPILFSGPMVRALLDGRKTQTRRILKLPTKGQYINPQMGGWEPTTIGGGASFTIERDGSRKPAPELVGIWHQTTGATIAALWQKGDRLWVRETWRTEIRNDGIKPSTLAPSTPVYYEAGGGDEEAMPSCAGRTRVSIHMPRWASRLTLTVTDVRVQRLQDISEEDAIAEGIERVDRGAAAPDGLHGWRYYKPSIFTFSDGENAVCCKDPRGSFQSLWEIINGNAAWDLNPWITAITFTVEQRNVDMGKER